MRATRHVQRAPAVGRRRSPHVGDVAVARGCAARRSGCHVLLPEERRNGPTRVPSREHRLAPAPRRGVAPTQPLRPRRSLPPIATSSRNVVGAQHLDLGDLEARPEPGVVGDAAAVAPRARSSPQLLLLTCSGDGAASARRPWVAPWSRSVRSGCQHSGRCRQGSPRFVPGVGPGDPRVTWRHEAHDLRRGPRGVPQLRQGVPRPRGRPPPRGARRRATACRGSSGRPPASRASSASRSPRSTAGPRPATTGSTRS